jgi:hypothetical protein
MNPLTITHIRPEQPAPFFSERSSDLEDEKNASAFFESRRIIRLNLGEEHIIVLRAPKGHQTLRMRMQRVIRPEAGEGRQVFDRTHQRSSSRFRN